MLRQNEAQPVQESFTQKDKVQILLSEYNTLRAEILARTGNMYQLFGAGAAVVLWLLTNSLSWSTLWVGLAFIILGGCFSWLIDRDMRKAAERLRQIEHDINTRVAEDLLLWESRWGGAVSGFFGPARPLSKEEAQAWLLKGADAPWVGQLLMFGWRAVAPTAALLRQRLSLVTTAALPICADWLGRVRRFTKGRM